MPPVTLTRVQVDQVRRVSEAVTARYQADRVAHHRFGAISGRRNANAFGAELAVAILTGGTWGRGDPRRVDVTPDLEVRWTGRYPPRLSVYPRSQDRRHLGRRFVLVTGRLPTFVVHGALPGLDVVAQGVSEWISEDVMTWSVDTTALAPIWPHVCGWARDDAGTWRCRQDHYAAGDQPATSCGGSMCLGSAKTSCCQGTVA